MAEERIVTSEGDYPWVERRRHKAEGICVDWLDGDVKEKYNSAHDILEEAANNIDNRAAERDMEQERSMGRAVAMFNAYSGRDMTETEGWMFMVCLKMARARAGKLNMDDYVDGAAYLALAGECEKGKS